MVLRNIKPIFIFWTRSFWFGILPAILIALDLMTQIVTANQTGVVAEMIALIPGISAEVAEKVLRGFAPFAALIVAWQRAGAARPYTLDATATE